MSRSFALLGSPVSHSASPAIHRAAFEAVGLDATYEAVEVTADDLPAALRAWAGSGGGNVTLPHKERAASLLKRASPAVEATGACNCFWLDERGALAGDNTDVGGFLGAARELLADGGLEGGRVLLLGAGGAARAVLAGCVRAGAARVDVRNRTVERARALVKQVAGPGGRARALTDASELTPPYDLVVQATSLGLDPEDPIPPSAAACGGRAALDLVYAPGGTAWVREARQAGIPALDGLSMLVRQAALSLGRWLPEVDPPLDAMRRAAERELRR